LVNKILYGNPIEGSQKKGKNKISKTWGSKNGPMSESTDTTTGGGISGI
jgi:hypothetical protein